MMTPQEVANCTFAKAVMGGYNMASVDDFLDKLTEDYAALYKENAALKSKLKVVADKLEEYREVEDAMRSTLLTAQKMASSMVSEAEAKRDALIADAAGAAKRRLEEIQQELADQEQRLADKRREVDEAIAAEERRLAAGQQGLRDFIQSVQSVCQGQLDLLQRLPELPPEPQPEAEPQPEEAEEVPVQPVDEQPAEEAGEEEEADMLDAATALEIQETIDAFAQETRSRDRRNREKGRKDRSREARGVRRETEPEAAGQEADRSDEDPDATRVLNLDDLQFGRNYTKEQ